MNRASWSVESLLESFEAHLRDCCGYAEATRTYYTRAVRRFLQTSFSASRMDLAQLGATDLIRFVSQEAARYKPKSVKGALTSLRSFLRFLQLLGLCDGQLEKALPTVPDWKLAALPTALSEQQLKRLLISFDRATPTGLRGYAIAVSLGELGLRAGEAAQLRLEDISWRSATLRIRQTKMGRARALPLIAETGRAIASYLREGRPKTRHRQVFVRHVDPIGAPINSSAIRAILRRAFERSGIDTPSKGTHILRRTAATRMLRAGASLKEIADVLGHRSLDTTLIYTKVHLSALAEVALPWPEVQP